MNELEKCAEILVECGYADGIDTVAVTPLFNSETNICLYYGHMGGINRYEDIQPFSDAIEGRRQADAIEDWLYRNHFYDLLDKHILQDYRKTTPHQRRVEKIKWCIDELIKNDS